MDQVARQLIAFGRLKRRLYDLLPQCIGQVARQLIAFGRLKRKGGWYYHLAMVGRKTTNRLRAIETFVDQADDSKGIVVARQLIAFGRLKRWEPPARPFPFETESQDN